MRSSEYSTRYEWPRVCSVHLFIFINRHRLHRLLIASIFISIRISSSCLIWHLHTIWPRPYNRVALQMVAAPFIWRARAQRRMDPLPFINLSIHLNVGRIRAPNNRKKMDNNYFIVHLYIGQGQMMERWDADSAPTWMRYNFFLTELIKRKVFRRTEMINAVAVCCWMLASWMVERVHSLRECLCVCVCAFCLFAKEFSV